MNAFKVKCRGVALAVALLLATSLLVACDGTRMPRVIASYPQRIAEQPIPQVTEAQVELDVDNAYSATREVAQLARLHGGTVLEQSRWRTDRGPRADLMVELPALSYEAFYRDLETVGRPVTERTVERVVYGAAYTRVRVELYEWPTPQVRGWSPAVTLGKAFAVFLRLFQVLVDGLIWLLVVGGPFVLMGIGLLAILRRVWKRES